MDRMVCSLKEESRLKYIFKQWFCTIKFNEHSLASHLSLAPKVMLVPVYNRVAQM
jgi:hypothetical protein